MEKKLNKIIHRAKEFSLREEERALMVQKISAYMKENPIVTAPVVSPYSKGLLLGFAIPLSVSVKKNKLILIPLAILLIFGTGTCFAASYSLPGSKLYPIKINVNEKLQSIFAFSTRAKAKVEAIQADNRLEETDQLSAGGTITPEIRAQIENNFETHTNALNKLTDDMKTTGNNNEADFLNSQFETDLGAHQAAVTELSANIQKNKNEEAPATIPGANSNLKIDGSSKAHINNSSHENHTTNSQLEPDNGGTPAPAVSSTSNTTNILPKSTGEVKGASIKRSIHHLGL